MSAAGRPRLRYVDTSLAALGIPSDSERPVRQIHLDHQGTISEAVEVYRGVFGLSDRADIRLTSVHGRVTIEGANAGPTLVAMGRGPITSTTMVVHR